jgi:hypothetical protein
MMMGGNFIAVHSLSHPGFVDILDDYYLRGYEVSGKKTTTYEEQNISIL